MFNIKLENFEGPLDLLLYFIKRDKIDIYDIPITQITNEYISVIDEAKKLDVSIAGEFLFMASMLLRIKTRMLLPRKVDEESLDIDDPRIDLVAQLLEYKKYKNIANKLKNLHFENKDSFFRSPSKVIYDHSPDISYFLNNPLNNVLPIVLKYQKFLKMRLIMLQCKIHLKFTEKPFL